MNLSEFFLQHEAILRLGSFLGVFAIMAVLEVTFPRRKFLVSRTQRWVNNLGLVAFNTLILRVVFPGAAVGLALFAAEHGWGLFNYYNITSYWLAIIAAVIFLDLAVYMQHLMMHAVPLFWRLHRVHHADLDFDITTGARFHTFEILLSMLIKLMVILLLGPSLESVIIFEVLLSATAIFNHSNMRIAPSADRWLRKLVVTPDMHRVHHSIDEQESNSNFGFNLPWWDHLFGTYLAQPRTGHETMTLGIRSFRDKKYCTTLLGMLALPFIRAVNHYAFGRRHVKALNSASRH